MKVLSLFSGVGGFDTGLETAGMETVFQCEWDKHCRNILDRHWPDVPKWDDVSTLTGKHVLGHAPVVDVVAWGSPCQDLSVAGKRAGLDGGRSGLFFEGIRIINEMREATNGQYPRISVWENVAGALSSNQGADFGVILDEMAKAGALVIEYALLDAQYFGVPQRRRRVFVVAIFDPATASRCPDPLLPVSESLPRYFASSKQKGKDTTSEIAAGFGSSNFGGWQETDTAITLSARDAKSSNTLAVEGYTPSSFGGYSEGVGTLRSNGGDLGGGTETIVVESPMLLDGRRNDDVRVYEEPVQTLGARMGTGGNNVPMIAVEPVAIGSQGNMIGRADKNGPQGKGYTNPGDPMFTLTGTDIHAVAYDEYNDSLGGDTHHALRSGTKQSTGVLVEAAGFKAGQSSDAGIGYQENVAATLGANMSGTEPSVLTPGMLVRRLTPVECEALQGWPRNHTKWNADGTEQADSHRYKQCGNGVASPVAAWIGGHLMKLDQP